MTKLSAVLFCIILSFQLQAQQVEKSISGSVGKIGFLEYKPSNYSNNGAKHPLIVFLHGIGERGNGNNKELNRVANAGLPRFIKNGHNMTFTVNGKTESFVVLSPQLDRRFGNWQVSIVDDIIEYAKRNLNIDPDRIFLTGLSLGGGGVWNYASSSAANARKLAGIAPVCGTCALKDARNISSNNLPVWAFHASNDGTVGVGCTNNTVNAINNLNPKVKAKKTIWPTGGHAIWDRVYDPKSNWTETSIYEWFLTVNSSSQGSNKKPVAKTGNDITVSSGNHSIKLDGSGSYDPDGNIVQYSWKKISGPGGNLIGNLLNKIGEIAGVLLPGTYVYELTVTDNDGESASEIIRINVTAVQPSQNKAPVANAGSEQTVTLPANSAILNGSQSQDPDGQIKKFEWTKQSGPNKFRISNGHQREAQVRDLVEGTYVFRLKVTDNDNASAVSDVTIKVITKNNDNKSPEADAGADITIKLPVSEVQLDGSKSNDPDGNIKKYEWTKTAGPSSFSIKNASNVRTKVQNLKAGTYSFRLTVTDNKNASASSEVKVTVEEAASNNAPISNPGRDQEIALPANTVVLNGSGSRDNDGKIVRYHWNLESGNSGSWFENKNDKETRLRNLRAGTYRVSLTVTDNDNLTDKKEITITVRDGRAGNGNNDQNDNGNGNGGNSSEPDKNPNKPQADAGGDANISEPANTVVLSGNRSKAPAGRIVRYEWSLKSGNNSAWFENRFSSTTRIRNLKQGTYVLVLTVTDNSGQVSTDEKRINVSARRGQQKSAAVSTVEVMEMKSSVATEMNSSNLNVYPNPASNQITVRSVNATTGNGVINIYDASGKLVQRLSVVKNQQLLQQTINVSGLKPGLYNLELAVDNKTKEMFKFMRQ